MVTLLTILCIFLSIPVVFAQLQTVCTGEACGQFMTADNVRELQAVGLSIDFFAVFFLMPEVIFTLTWLAVGTVTSWHKSNDTRTDGSYSVQVNPGSYHGQHWSALSLHPDDNQFVPQDSTNGILKNFTWC